ncbi:MAG: hypothetical protein JXM70_14390 [Pirellulales bacterium]|nr:hypothetical protein [Pirellulales bacterium]
MSNADDDTLDFEDLNMPSDGMPDPTASKLEAAETLDLEEAAEPAMVDDAEAVDDLLENIEAEDDSDKPTVKKAGLLSKVTEASPYTVMLAISVLAIGVALLCLMLEWSTYDFQRKPPKTLTMSRTENVDFPDVCELNSHGNSLAPVERRTS